MPRNPRPRREGYTDVRTTAGGSTVPIAGMDICPRSCAESVIASEQALGHGSPLVGEVAESARYLVTPAVTPECAAARDVGVVAGQTDIQMVYETIAALVVRHGG